MKCQATVQASASLDCIQALVIPLRVLNACDSGSVMKMVGHVLQEWENPKNNKMGVLVIGMSLNCYKYWGVSKEMNITLFSISDPIQKWVIEKLVLIQHYGGNHKRTLAEMMKKAISIIVADMEKRVQANSFQVGVILKLNGTLAFFLNGASFIHDNILNADGAIDNKPPLPPSKRLIGLDRVTCTCIKGYDLFSSGRRD